MQAVCGPCSFLRDGELCACQVAEALALAPSTVSRHMTDLVRAGLVSARKSGRWVYYARVDCRAHPAAGVLLGWIDAHAAAGPEVARDARVLAKLRKLGPEALCAGKERKPKHGQG